MKEIETYRNKNVLILGLAKSGYAVAKVLLKLGARITVNDAGNLGQSQAAQELASEGVKIVDNGHPVSLFQQGFAYMIKNPGIPYENPMVKEAQRLGVPILTEPEVAAEVSSAPLIGITGSNGKTTTTMLTAAMLNVDRKKGHAYAVGNIGTPISEVVLKATEDDILVCELSSFQLLGVTTLAPKAAAIVDIYPTHLDYHKTFDNYVNAKLNITRHQTKQDFFIGNFDQPDIWAKEQIATHAQMIPFTLTDEQKQGAYLSGKNICYQDQVIMSTEEIKLPGRHNVQNALVAIAITKQFGVSNTAIKKVLTTFSGVEHRLQFVKELNGRKIYNDSKSTNIEAATVAINSFSQPEVLIAGGLDRGFTFEPLIKPFQEHVHAIVLYGETKELMRDAAEKAGISDIIVVDTLQEAVPAAYHLTAEGDILLFSPACASWDQFKTFEQRGEFFMKYVNELE